MVEVNVRFVSSGRGWTITGKTRRERTIADMGWLTWCSRDVEATEEARTLRQYLVNNLYMYRALPHIERLVRRISREVLTRRYQVHIVCKQDLSRFRRRACLIRYEWAIFEGSVPLKITIP